MQQVLNLSSELSKVHTEVNGKISLTVLEIEKIKAANLEFASKLLDSGEEMLAGRYTEVEANLKDMAKSMTGEAKAKMKPDAGDKFQVKANNKTTKWKAKQDTTAMVEHRSEDKEKAEELDANLEAGSPSCVGAAAVAAASRDCWHAAHFVRGWLEASLQF